MVENVVQVACGQTKRGMRCACARRLATVENEMKTQNQGAAQRQLVDGDHSRASTSSTWDAFLTTFITSLPSITAGNSVVVMLYLSLHGGGIRNVQKPQATKAQPADRPLQLHMVTAAAVSTPPDVSMYILLIVWERAGRWL